MSHYTNTADHFNISFATHARINEIKANLKKKYNEYKKEEEKQKQKLIHEIKGIDKQTKKITKKISKPKPKPKPKPKTHPKSFHDYFLECIKNKTIPNDTPVYPKKALVRALKEYERGIKYVKSGLDGFAIKHIIKGIPKLLPIEYF